MKALFALILAGSTFVPSAGYACSSVPATEQAVRDALALAQQRATVRALGREADSIVVGTVLDLRQSSVQAPQPGHVALRVDETLKGSPRTIVKLLWQESGVISCDPATDFTGIGFKEGGRFIVYARDGVVLQSRATERPATRGRLGFDAERALLTAEAR